MWLLPRPLARRGRTIACIAVVTALSAVLSVAPRSTNSIASAETLADQSTCPAVTDSVVRLYSAYFLRAPDDDGFRYWADQWGSGEWDLPAISDFFARSPEFDQLYGGLGDAAFVDLVYRNVLGRPGEGPGRAFWTGRLDDGMTRGRLMLEFSDGVEFVQITATTSPVFPPSGTVFDCLPEPGVDPLPPTDPGGTDEPVAAVRARSALAAATVVDAFDPVGIGYDRDEYSGRGYRDADGDCINARHETLIDESRSSVMMTASGCSVSTGRWVDPYDGAIYTSASSVQIDHVVPLGHAHRAGAWRWDDDTKERFYSDIAHPATLAATGAASNGSKADRGPEDWKPPLATAWCAYAIDWIDIKTRWDLTYRSVERDALVTMLDTCADSVASGGVDLDGRANGPTVATITLLDASSPESQDPTPQPPVEPPTGTDADVVIAHCHRRSEVVRITNLGGQVADLAGHVLHDEGENHTFDLGSIRLEPGASIDILTGPDAADRPGAVVWKLNHIWNNDGDTAFLVGPSGQLDSQVCTNV